MYMGSRRDMIAVGCIPQLSYRDANTYT